MSQVFEKLQLSTYCYQGRHEDGNAKRKCNNKTKKCQCNCHSIIPTKKITVKYAKNKSWSRKEDEILYLLKTQKANSGMICSFANTNHGSARQIITNLRKKGHDILLDYNKGGGFYEYMGCVL